MRFEDYPMDDMQEDEDENYTEQEIADMLMGLAEEAKELGGNDFRTFEEAGVLTTDKGFCFACGDRDVYVTVQTQPRR